MVCSTSMGVGGLKMVRVHQWVWVAYRWCVYINGYGWPIDGVSTSMCMGGL